MLIKAWLLLALFVIFAFSAPTELLRQKRQEEQEQEQEQGEQEQGGLIGGGVSRGKNIGLAIFPILIIF